MAKQVEVPIPHNTAYQLIADQVVGGVNKINLVEFLMQSLSTEQKSFFIMLSQLKHQYVPPIGGDYVKFHQDATWIESKIDMDVMLDMGLMEDGYLFGKVKKIDDYGNAYKPFQARTHVELFCHDKDKKLIKDGIRIDTSNLIVITKSCIPHFHFEIPEMLDEENI